VLRQVLVREGIDANADADCRDELIPKPVCVQLLQMQESRFVKEHLTN
jgi:hypothetical protein